VREKEKKKMKRMKSGSDFVAIESDEW